MSVTGFQAFMVGLEATTISAGVAMYVVVLNYLRLHLCLLMHSIENLDSRANELYNSRGGNENLNFDRKLYNKCFNECLIENIKHHQRIIRLHRLYVKMSSIPVFVPLIAGALLMALAAVHFISDDVRIGPKLTSGTILFGELLNMGLLCVYGDQVKTLGENARDTMYGIRWYDLDKECHQILSIFQEMTLKPLNIKCVYILDINMETFATLVSSTYSYINLVYAFK